jgi:hypothetical protein
MPTVFRDPTPEPGVDLGPTPAHGTLAHGTLAHGTLAHGAMR